MDHGGEVPRPMTAELTDLAMASPVQEGEVHMSTVTIHGQLGAYHNSAEFARLGGAVPVADDLGAVYDNRRMAGEHMRRLFAFVGIATSSVAVNWLAAGPGSPAVAFHLFVLLLGGLLVVILHVLCV